MKTIKDELQHIILGNEPSGNSNTLKKIRDFLRENAETSINAQKKQYLKSEEAAKLIAFAESEDLFYNGNINEEHFISAGAEQRVYRYDDFNVIKTNDSIFYEYWLDYFNSLLLHNYFFPSTVYSFLGFKIIDNRLHAVVKQEFIVASEHTNLAVVKQFLAHNGFQNTRNNDYINPQLGIIFEDLHDENVLSDKGVLFFIDTVFYLTEDFYK